MGNLGSIFNFSTVLRVCVLCVVFDKSLIFCKSSAFCWDVVLCVVYVAMYVVMFFD